MKKLINAPESVVADALAGLAAAHPDLSVDVERRFVHRAAHLATAGKVALVSGGGSGHEPLHAGFVGPGMLDAACAGEVFTSPVPDQMLAAAQATHAGAGVLFLVKNYTGDVLNFQMAAELLEDEGIESRSVLINDDVAVEDSLYTAGRRGTGATLFAEKIAGALAERGADLAAVAALAERVNAQSRSFGIALGPCTTPAPAVPASSWARTRSSSASASTASRAGAGPRWPRPPNWRRRPWTRSAPTSTSPARRSRWSTAWARAR
jgi:dihydroxyacetone kinase-like protein